MINHFSKTIELSRMHSDLMYSLQLVYHFMFDNIQISAKMRIALKSSELGTKNPSKAKIMLLLMYAKYV
jgi:hypothetical protein